MSHYSLLVITDSKPTESVLAGIMLPWQEVPGNEDSKWDWYQIGGRWSGALDPSYDPATDPRNIETCNLCAGTGMRNDDGGRKARSKDPTYTCNGCDGKGTAVKWPTQWTGDVPGNQTQVKELKPDADLGFFAFLRAGQWVEKGEMGWWGVVRDEKNPASWAAEKSAVIASLRPDEWLTVVDRHI